MKNTPFLCACLLMGTVIWASNWLISMSFANPAYLIDTAFSTFVSHVALMVSGIDVPSNGWFTYATFTFPVCFLITDTVNRFYGVTTARKVVVFGFVVGVALSWYFADVRIALASGTAFMISQMLDVTIFDRLRKASWWKAPMVSSAVASVLDTTVFYTLAFYGQDWPWVTIGMGDLFVKLIMAVALIPIYRVMLGVVSQYTKPV